MVLIANGRIEDSQDTLLDVVGQFLASVIFL